MTKKAIIWTVVGSILGLAVVAAITFICIGLFGATSVATLFPTIVPISTITKEDAQNIISSIPKNKSIIEKSCYQTYDKTVNVPEINNNKNVYSIQLDASYEKCLVNDTLYLKFNDLSQASLTQNTTIEFSKKPLASQADIDFYRKIKAIKIILMQKQAKATNHRYIINMKEEAFSQLQTLTDFGIYNENSDYSLNDNWVGDLASNVFPVSLVNFYCEASFWPFSNFCTNSNELFINNVNIKNFVYNGQIYSDTWLDENNNLYEPYLFSSQYTIPKDCFDNCGKDFKLFSTVTYGFINDQQKLEFEKNKPKDFEYKKIPMFFDYKSDWLINDWGLPSWVFDWVIPDYDHLFKKIPLLLMIYRFDYYYTAKEYPPPSKLPFKGKLFSGFYINRTLYNTVYKK